MLLEKPTSKKKFKISGIMSKFQEIVEVFNLYMTDKELLDNYQYFSFDKEAI
jgi:hypothetical protein